MLSSMLLSALLASASSADAAYEEGVRALKQKDAKAAAAALERCVTSSPEKTACHWELGWAYWLMRDWKNAVAHWETVKRQDPKHPEVDDHLEKARANLRLADDLANDADAAPATTSGKAPDGTTLRLRAVGDVMVGTDFPEGHLSPEDGAEVMRAVYPLMKDADLTFANLEGPFCDSGETKKCKSGGNCYAFRSPTRYGQYLTEAGIDIASTANNHSGDFGMECREQTEAMLDKLGIAWSGRAGTVAHTEKNGLKIAMIGFHTGDGVNYVNDHETAAAMVRREAKTNDIVIVSFHGGAEGSKAQHVPEGMEEFYGEKRGDLRTFTHLVVDAGADLVLGHGPHVLRGMEIYNDRLIAYSLGNFATYGRFTLSGPLGVGAVLEVTLDREGKLVGGKVLSTRQEGAGIAVPDKSGEAIKLVRKLSREDFPQSHVVVAKDGSFGPR